jgi:hypothetical protein
MDIEKNGTPKTVVASNLKLIELCEGGPYEARGFLIQMTQDGPNVVGDMVFRVESPDLVALGFIEFSKALKLLMKNPRDILTPDPDTVRQINRTKGS